MTYQERLHGICQMINERREEEGGHEWTMCWRIDPGDTHEQALAVALIDLAYKGESGDHVVLVWYMDGRIEARVTLKEPISGAITAMTVLAAAHPQATSKSPKPWRQSHDRH